MVASLGLLAVHGFDCWPASFFFFGGVGAVVSGVFHILHCTELAAVNLTSLTDLDELVISGCFQMESLAVHCPLITQLDLSHSVALKEISLECPMLTELMLVGCRAIDDAGIAPLGGATAIPAVEVIDLWGCGRLSMGAIEALVSTLSRRQNPGQPSTSSNIAPSFFKLAHNLNVRCVLVPAPWMLVGPKHLGCWWGQNTLDAARAKTHLESRIKKFTPHCIYDCFFFSGLKSVRVGRSIANINQNGATSNIWIRDVLLLFFINQNTIMMMVYDRALVLGV